MKKALSLEAIGCSMCFRFNQNYFTLAQKSTLIKSEAIKGSPETTVEICPRPDIKSHRGHQEGTMAAAEEVNAKSALHEGQANLTEVSGAQEVKTSSTVH